MIRIFSLLLFLMFICGATPARSEDFQKTIAPDDLKKFLPIAPEGWKVVDVSSQNDTTADAPTTTAQCRYIQSADKEADPATRVDLQINDWINRTEALRRMIRMWAMTNDKDEKSYIRGSIVAGYPAEESYDKTTSTHSITLIVGGRYSINLDVYNRPPEALMLWLDRIDLKLLATAK